MFATGKVTPVETVLLERLKVADNTNKTLKGKKLLPGKERYHGTILIPIKRVSPDTENTVSGDILSISFSSTALQNFYQM